MDFEYEEKFDKFQTRVMKFVIYKRRTKKEIIQKFKDFESFDEFMIRALKNLSSFGYIDDKKYAYDFILENIKLKHSSLFEIKMKLAKKGVERVDIEQAIYEIQDEYGASVFEEYEKNSIEYLLKNRKNKTYPQNYNYLKNKGFNSFNISKVLKNK